MTGSAPSTVGIRRIVLCGVINDNAVGPVVRQIHAINQEGVASAIELHIATSGGFFGPGFGLYDVIRLSAIPVDTVAFGYCASMGMPILQAGRMRYATENARLMIHPSVAGGASGSRAGEAKACGDENVAMEEVYYRVQASRCGRTLTQFKKFMGERRYMSATEALKENFIDAIKKQY